MQPTWAPDGDVRSVCTRCGCALYLEGRTWIAGGEMIGARVNVRSASCREPTASFYGPHVPDVTAGLLHVLREVVSW